jgi:cytidine deaminase
MDLAKVTVERLIEAAHRAQAQAYSPYSNFAVGAAVLGADGRVFLGCNVENSSFGLTVCAERNAVAAALVAGTRPAAVAVVVNGKAVAPCGACRQVLAEFDPGMPVVLASATDGHRETTSLDALLPGAFRFEKP